MKGTIGHGPFSSKGWEARSSGSVRNYQMWSHTILGNNDTHCGNPRVSHAPHCSHIQRRVSVPTAAMQLTPRIPTTLPKLASFSPVSHPLVIHALYSPGPHCRYLYHHASPSPSQPPVSASCILLAPACWPAQVGLNLEVSVVLGHNIDGALIPRQNSPLLFESYTNLFSLYED